MCTFTFTLSGGVNIDTIVTELDDGSLQFGTSGIADDDIRETSFVLSHEDVDLTIDMVLGQDFAARLTSVGEEGGTREHRQ